MLPTSARLLRLLSILQSRGYWTAEELAERLEVTTRTVRNDVARLRLLGYHVDSLAGPGGGYWLGTTAALPPLLFDDDEAVAVAVALKVVTISSVDSIDEIGARALAKLLQLLPPRLRPRMAALEAAVTASGRRTEQVSLGMLAGLAAACSERRVLSIRYTAADGATTERTIEPHRLLHDRARWYLLAWDPDRADWRTFRVDRIDRHRDLRGRRRSHRVPPPTLVDGSDGPARPRWRYRAVVEVEASADAMVARVPDMVMVEPLAEGRCRLHVGSSDPDTLAVYLAMLDADFTIVDAPERPELVAAVATLADRLHRAAGRT